MTSKETELLHIGDDRANQRGAINTPVYRASLFSFPTYEDFLAEGAKGRDGTLYSRVSNPTRAALEAKIAYLEHGDHAFAVSSGMAATSASLLAFLNAGDHLLVVSSCYGPTRHFSNWLLSRYGVEVEFFHSDESSDLSHRIKPNTRVIYLESPGSLTMQIQDLRAVAKLAKQHNIVTMIDNTYATPLYQQPIDLGIDIVIHTGTKYLGGHSDLMSGVIVCKEEHYSKLQPVVELLGAALSPDDAYLVTRGLRTLAVRLERQGASALKIAQWLQNRPEVSQVYYPGLPEFPGHELAKSQMSGFTGLLSFSVEPAAPQEAQHAFINALKYFSIGVSWGGYESLALPNGNSYRDAPDIREQIGITDEIYRISIGLEDVDDLIADLDNAFKVRAEVIANLK